MSFFEECCPDMDRYLEDHASAEPSLLRSLRRETFLKTTQPHMISGYQQGRLLAILSGMLRPKNILEIGTFTGYATLCLAEGLSLGGKITTLDVNEELAYLPRKYFEQSQFSGQINFQLRDAKEYLQENSEMFDLIFIDADKENYVQYFHLTKEKLNAGGVLLFDNVLWYGKVLEADPKQTSTKRIKELNAAVTADPDFQNVILPLRDGLHLIRKI